MVLAMLKKFETKSNRVKGVAFHPKRSLLLASLHNGTIQLWDWRMGTLLEKFREHEGPVRGIAFHPSQPLFASGGDDFKIKLWSLKTRRCLFTILDHLDYVRTLDFHRDLPWILSASDDQTIRIWNWQSRGKVAALTGHNHYVMCALFHPTKFMVLSASLDYTVRVWDVSGLMNKATQYQAANVADIFGSSDAQVKFVLEGHDRGVNWACFHPTQNLIASASDDRRIKFWRFTYNKAFEVDTLRGHFNNVSCVVFHPSGNQLISDSEDRSLRVWDVKKRLCLATFRREHDRFWVVAAHPSQHLLAAGHDAGLFVFKLERERPPHAVLGAKLFYLRRSSIHILDTSTKKDDVIVTLKEQDNENCESMSVNSFNPVQHCLMLNFPTDVELFIADKSASATTGTPTNGVRIPLNSAVFVARNRILGIKKGSSKLHMYALDGTFKKELDSPLAGVTAVFEGGVVGQVILSSGERLVLFDSQSQRVIQALPFQNVRRMVWSQDRSFVAIFTKHTLSICNRQLEQQSSITETVRLKSGTWTSTKVFVYVTYTHIKYMLPNGDTGVIRSMDEPIYLTHVTKNRAHALDRKTEHRILRVSSIEYEFKKHLLAENYHEVLRIIRTHRLCGHAIVSYLQKAGYPEVALHFVEDKAVRFNLAVDCGNIEVALEMAHQVDDPSCWRRLAVAALQQGNHQVVEMAFQRTKDFERLSFLYLITGNTDKLSKMLKIAEMRGDTMSRFHNSLYLGDALERVKVLESAGQLALAYACAATHGLMDDADRLKEYLLTENPEAVLPEVLPNARLLIPPPPIMKEENWPLLTVGRGVFESLQQAEALDDQNAPTEDIEGDTNIAAWGGDDDLDLGDDVAPSAELTKEDVGDAWGAEDDLDLGDADVWDGAELDLGDVPGVTPDDAGFVCPMSGREVSHHWTQNSQFAVDRVAAGEFGDAMVLLNQQHAVINFEPLKPLFLQIFAASHAALPTREFPSPPLRLPLHRNGTEKPPGSTSLPRPSLTFEKLLTQLKEGYRLFHQGKFRPALTAFRSLLQSVVLLAVTRAKETEVKELVGICREYITALRLESARREEGLAPARVIELLAYITHCNLQVIHLLLSLNLAMSTSFKSKNFLNSTAFARRLLELPDISAPKHAALRTKARKVLALSEKSGSNAHDVDYDERNPFQVCSVGLKPIYKGTPFTKCSLCGSAALPEHAGSVCPTCELSSIGGLM